MIVLIDQDGVLADFDHGLFVAMQVHSPRIAPVPPAERRHFRAVEDYPLAHRETVVAAYSSPGFFASLPVVGGALSGVLEMLAEGIDVRVCTAPVSAFEHCVVEKYQWIERHFGRRFTDRVILTKDKTLVHGDWLIDDNAAVVGVRRPTWRHAVYDAPYNRDVRLPRLQWSTWREVIA